MRSGHYFERAELVPERGRIGEKRWEERLRVAQGVGEDAHLWSLADDRPRVEGPEVERLIVQVPPRDRIRREVHLEAPVEQEPVPLVGPHAAADVIRRLEDGDLRSAFSEYLCTGEAGQPGPDYNSFHTRESVTHNSQRHEEGSKLSSCRAPGYRFQASGYARDSFRAEGTCL